MVLWRWTQSKFLITTSVIGSIVGACVLLRDFLIRAPQPLDNKIRADEKVVIITGASTGIGKETARELSKRGAIVYMACRDLVKCEEARKEIVLETKNRRTYCRKCDLADFNSIRDFVKEFVKTEKQLDILINNAGIMRCPRMVTKQGIEMQLGVNHMGHFLLTNLLLDVLKKSSPSRIVVVSSVAHARGKINFEDLNSQQSYHPGAAYNQSKLANILFMKELHLRLQGTKVTVNALHPGLVNTEIARHMWISNSTLGTVFVGPFLSLFLKSPQQGAATTLMLALDPSLENTSGKYFSDCKQQPESPIAEDMELAKRLWIASEKWTNNTATVSENMKQQY